MPQTVHPVVLVVDDNVIIRNILQASLSREGYEVRVAATGDEALSVALTLGSELAVALVDLRVGPEQGLNILGRLRAVVPALPCCIITGDLGSFTEEELLARGARRILMKPFVLHTLVDAVREAIGH